MEQGLSATPGSAEIAARLCELAAHTHAAMAELAHLAAALDEAGGWRCDGMRSFSAWLSVNAGFAPRTGDELLRVGLALRELPRIREAFSVGSLSFDSVRELTTVASGDDEHLWLDVAASASGAQLARICRGCRRALELDTPAHADQQLRRRGLWWHFDDDGMLNLRALLCPEDGAVVLAAIEAAHVAARRDGEAPAPDPAQNLPVSDLTDEPWAAQRADALVGVCDSALAGGGLLPSDPSALPMIVHVDVGVLTGQDPAGRRHVEGGPTLPLTTLRRLGCDTSVITITERDSIPINVGRLQRILPRALRRAVQGRDRACRFPGCAVPSQRTHAHHVEHWADGGSTSLQNLVSLCHFHHRRLHDGAFDVRGSPSGELRFIASDGQPIAHRLRRVEWAGSTALRSAIGLPDTVAIGPDTPGTRDGTAGLNLGYVVSVVSEAVARARPPAAAPT